MKFLNIRFKIITTAMFLMLTLFAAGFAAHSSQSVWAGSETVSVQQTVDTESFGGAFDMVLEADGLIPS